MTHGTTSHDTNHDTNGSGTMRIGILGTGAMAAALGGAWVRAGHSVMVGGRDAAAAAGMADRIGAAGHGGLVEAARYGEAVLVAVPADVAPKLVEDLGPDLAGRTLLDCTVPMAPGADGPGLTTAGGTDSVAERLAAAAPEAHVAKVFGICHESIWTLPRPAFEGAPLAVPFCADAPSTAALVAELVTSMGCDPMACGGLERAALLEAAAVFAIGVWWSGGEARHAFPAPALAPGAVDD
ncbi:NAD(P)-binding domain-containing protein [Streptomyces sp. XD-27]|uniref:NAD(P)-binding domain-containing protein n=1 Tax=Streptomyces sp. XD-27 TaxID=3062779 RepID=UPI0026F45AEC|nr:NAD(P)-binding domain-containing protein [Streptomyces sp. XD-27]WKX71903.1 NAD(P)-binding domain-containing protein [Streptomyces sp. XD-27]